MQESEPTQPHHAETNFIVSCRRLHLYEEEVEVAAFVNDEKARQGHTPIGKRPSTVPSQVKRHTRKTVLLCAMCECQVQHDECTNPAAQPLRGGYKLPCERMSSDTDRTL